MRIFTFLVITFAIGSAQSQTKIPAACEKASPQVETLIRSAIESFDANEAAESIKTLKKILEVAEIEKVKGLCKAWVFQWLALCYDDLDSLETARKYVMLSLKKDLEIWRLHADSRLTPRLRKTYQDSLDKIQTFFMKKRKSWRVALGSIARIDFSNRYGVVTGIGTTVVSLEDTSVSTKDTGNNFEVNLFRDLLFYVRMQRIRKTIERLSAGFYGEISLLFPLKKEEWKKPDKAVSFGPILSYAWQSGWEFGGTFEIARLVIGDGTTRISQTIFLGKEEEKKKSALSYANFEIYLRKWF